MKYDPHKHHRRSIRLKNYDYSQPGTYFVTICAKQRLAWFGNVYNGVMRLNGAGQMVAETWASLPERFPHIALDTFIVMPDHMHGCIHIVAGPTPAPVVRFDGRPKGTLLGTLGRVLQAFKSLTTGAYIQGVEKMHWMPFERRLWLRNYYDSILSDEQALHAIRSYIVHNPMRWSSKER